MKMIEGKANGHYSPAVVSRGQVFVSGQLSRDPATGQIPPTVREETLQALKNVENVLASAGAGLEDVVMCRVYVAGIKLWDEVNRAYEEVFKDHRPARAVVPVAELHFGCSVEIEAVAELPEDN
ncbi:MAG: RidA family protein [Firmicutes bacterium]|nr:RidA family protein [Bacillota bacterium]MBR0115344.1 RidA family protein [Bacillota bacterium]MBR0442409.1 RidA family protein [Bacillota bacterium]